MAILGNQRVDTFVNDVFNFPTYAEAYRVAALEVVERCACVSGCPACVGTLEEVGALGKETAEGVLAHLLRAGELVSVPFASPEADLEGSA